MICDLASRSKHFKNNSFFLQKGFSCNNVWLSKDTAFILKAFYLFSSEASNELSFDLKMLFWKFDLWSRSWPDRKRSNCISVDPYGRSKYIYGVFIALVGLYKKFKSYCRKTAGDLLWPEMTLATLRGVTGRNIPIQGVKSTCNPMFESVSNGFLPNEGWGAFHFSPIDLFIMERSQNWPDHGSPISKFRDKHFIHTGRNINRWKFQGDRAFGVAMTIIQTFSDVRSLLDVTWWHDHEWPGSEIFTKCVEKMYEQLNKTFSYLRKTWRGGV